MSTPAPEPGAGPTPGYAPGQGPAGASAGPPVLAPGWYNAGVVAQERWWSGTEWTGYVRPTPYSEKWDRPGWGANPEVMVALSVLCVVMFFGFQLVVLSFFWNGELVRGVFGFLVTLGFPTFAIIGFMSARIGFRRKSLGRPAAGEFPRPRAAR
jgi:hypothetical protein